MALPDDPFLRSESASGREVGQDGSVNPGRLPKIYLGKRGQAALNSGGCSSYDLLPTTLFRDRVLISGMARGLLAKPQGQNQLDDGRVLSVLSG